MRTLLCILTVFIATMGLTGCAAWKNRISCKEYKNIQQEHKLHAIDIKQHFYHNH